MRPKIMIVDDEPDVCEAISHYLGKRDYDVITATSAREAINKLLNEKPLLVLLDIKMPDIDGIECLQMIKKLDKEALVVMVTCVSDLEPAKQPLALGAVDYITKPLCLEAIETAVSTYLFLHSL